MGQKNTITSTCTIGLEKISYGPLLHAGIRLLGRSHPVSGRLDMLEEEGHADRTFTRIAESKTEVMRKKL